MLKQIYKLQGIKKFPHKTYKIDNTAVCPAEGQT
jgi:hypothetical protein